MKKKILALILVSVLSLSLTACGGVVGEVMDNVVQDDYTDDVNDNVNNDVNDDIDNDVNDDTIVDNDDDASTEDDNTDTQKLKSEGELQFTIPEGFTYDETDDMYYSEDALANFYYMTTDNDGSFAITTRELMESTLETSLSASFGATIDVVMESWEDVTVDGYEAIRYEISYEYAGFPIEQTQVIVNGTDNYHFITFTDMSDGTYEEAFKTCEESLGFGE